MNTQGALNLTHDRCSAKAVVISSYLTALEGHMLSELGAGELKVHELISVLESLPSVWGITLRLLALLAINT